MRTHLARIVGDAHVAEPRPEELRDASVASGVSGRADAVVRPATPEEVAAVVAWCYAHDVPVVPRGGGTGYAGGAVPLDGGVVLALDRLAAVRSLEPGLWRMEAEAGVTTATVARRARESGLLFPPDPGAAEQSQLGGNVATNAGGPHTFKYGVTGTWVSGLEAVVAPGELIRVGGPVRKDVAGYDLRSLLVGSEGTLGIVTAAWLRLIPAPEAALPVAAAFADTRAGCAALEAVLGSGAIPAALEFLDGATLALAAGSYPGELPAGAVGAATRGDAAPFLLLAEADGSADEARRVRDELVAVFGDAGALAVDAPGGTAAIDAIWRWRGGVSHAVTARRGGKLSEDVAVPVERLAETIEGTLEIGARHGLEACSWGHAGDGNVHATFLLDPGDRAQLGRARDAAEDLFALALALGGTVSGEHGIGLLKNGQLARQWDAGAVRLHRTIKDALDPKGLLNPGKKLA